MSHFSNFILYVSLFFLLFISLLLFIFHVELKRHFYIFIYLEIYIPHLSSPITTSIYFLIRTSQQLHLYPLPLPHHQLQYFPISNYLHLHSTNYLITVLGHLQTSSTNYSSSLILSKKKVKRRNYFPTQIPGDCSYYVQSTYTNSPLYLVSPVPHPTLTLGPSSHQRGT